MDPVWISGLAFILVLPGAASPQGSPGLKNQVASRMGAIDKQAETALGRLDADLAAGKLSQGRQRRMALANLGRVLFGLADAVDKAVAGGRTLEDPDIGAAVTKLKSVQAELEKRGFWTCYAAGEAPLKDRATPCSRRRGRT